jgi:hypothetical protein
LVQRLEQEILKAAEEEGIPAFILSKQMTLAGYSDRLSRHIARMPVLIEKVYEEPNDDSLICDYLYLSMWWRFAYINGRLHHLAGWGEWQANLKDVEVIREAIRQWGMSDNTFRKHLNQKLLEQQNERDGDLNVKREREIKNLKIIVRHFSSLKKTKDFGDCLLAILNSHQWWNVREQNMMTMSDGQVLDMKTLERRAPRWWDLATGRAKYNYSPTCLSPGTEVEKKLVEIFSDEKGEPCPQKMADAQLALGYSITLSLEMKKFFIWWGKSGDNGKSFVFNMVRAATDGLNVVKEIPKGVLLYGKSMNELNEKTAMVGIPCCYTSEMTKGAMLNEENVKALVGEKFCTVRYMKQNPIEVPNVTKGHFLTNAPLSFRGCESMEKKVAVFQLYQRFCDNPNNKNPCDRPIDRGLYERLTGSPVEMQWLFSWLLEGAQRFLNGEMTFSAVTETETLRYLDGDHVTSPVQAFLKTLFYCPKLKPPRQLKTASELLRELQYSEYVADPKDKNLATAVTFAKHLGFLEVAHVEATNGRRYPYYRTKEVVDAALEAAKKAKKPLPDLSGRKGELEVEYVAWKQEEDDDGETEVMPFTQWMLRRQEYECYLEMRSEEDALVPFEKYLKESQVSSSAL